MINASPERFASLKGMNYSTSNESNQYRERWEDASGSLEIRMCVDKPTALDEVLASNAEIHLEQMSYDAWFMGIQAVGMTLHLNFWLQDGKLKVQLRVDEEEEDAMKVWDGDPEPYPGQRIS
jgi:hypothetical protein